ncbi:MAG: UDP-4-amino-4,6-dideoxy-N-acetyl-beta-L-altrosamine transaminase [Candidatus Peribacteraceae bacterium]|nr:UDP-4-amino-4,6-dideoxy-N-acetyl-beta-L-altrosamine transaminase [Candidatus Peribacteraceae bacterium]
MTARLAIDGGTPVRATLLPYGRQSVSDEDIRAVNDVLRSDWLTTGPKVSQFEKAFASFTGAKEAVAVSNGTAALHAAMYGAQIRPGDDVIVPAMTFAASANAAVYLGATPVFADVDSETLLIDPKSLESRLTKKTKVVVAVDYAGQPCDYGALRAITEKKKLTLIADACHALGGTYKKKPVGSLADLSTFSFHPVKPIATGEGGMITTDDPDVATRMRRFRNHGITTDHRERQEKGAWFYEMPDVGYNYRLTDIQCALGISQLTNVPAWTKRRQALAKKYDAAFSSMKGLKPLSVRSDVTHAYHLYVIQLDLEGLSADRNQIFQALRAENIGVNVHYIPVHLHPYYRKNFGTKEGMCPVAEKAFERILSLPMFATMTDDDAGDVITAMEKVLTHYSR